MEYVEDTIACLRGQQLAQSRSFVPYPPAFDVFICLILFHYTSFSTRARFGILRGYFYLSFKLATLLLVWFGCFSCLRPVHSGVIYPDSALIHLILGTFVYILLHFATFSRHDAFVVRVTHPSVFLKGECKCGYPQFVQISGELPLMVRLRSFPEIFIFSTPQIFTGTVPVYYGLAGLICGVHSGLDGRVSMV